MKKIFKIFFIFSVVVLVFSIFIYVKYDAKNISKIFEDRYSVSVLDDKNEIIGVQLNKDEQWHLKSEDSPPDKLKICILNFEDKDFYYHHGVDVSAIVRAFRDNTFYGRKTGGSTITMQVVKMASPKKRNYVNKYIEMIQSLKLERYFSKDEIFMMYINNAPYGGNIVGYKTASYIYFQKNPNKLTWAESALIAVLPNSPGLMNIEKNRKKLENKRNRLLKKLYDKNIIDERQYLISIKEPLPEKRYNFKNIAPHFMRRVINENQNKIIKTTINSEIQEKTQKIVKDYSEFLRTQGINNIAVLIVNNKNNEVKSYIGSQDFYDFSTNGQVDGIIAKRSPGSVLKPFLYALSIDEGILVPESKVPDVPLYFTNFNPQNANKKYYGMIEIKEALIKSLNIPFVQLLREYGEDKFFFFLKNVLDFEDSDYSRYGLSLILGTKEFSVEDIGKLYSGLANYGEFRDLKYLKGENEKIGERYISKGAAYLTLSTIKRLERAGIERMYIDKNPISWKTGTSYGQRDGWAAGVTPDWTVIVWVGNFTGESSPNLSGIMSAGNLLFNIFKILPKIQKDFEIPENSLKKIKVDSETGYRLKYDVPYKEVLYPTDAKPLKTSPYYKRIFVNDKGVQIDSRDKDFLHRKEKIILNYPVEVINYFISENLDISNIFNLKSNEKTIKFIYPLKNLRIVIPKDFDGEKNLILKVANIKNQELYWYINKKYIGKGKTKERSINLKSGKYEVVVVAENGEVIKTNFEIINKK